MGDYFLQQVVNALSAGSLYALMAVGLAMVFGILRLINFAHGDLMMIAAYLAAFSLGAGLPLAVAIPIMVAGTVLVALLMERIAYRPIRGAPDVAMLLSSFAVGEVDQPEDAEDHRQADGHERVEAARAERVDHLLEEVVAHSYAPRYDRSTWGSRRRTSAGPSSVIRPVSMT